MTHTPSGCPVTQDMVNKRFASVAFVKDYRIKQLNKNSYRVLILPEPDGDRRSIKGSVLDALVDLYGIHGNFDIDIIEDDDVLMP